VKVSEVPQDQGIESGTRRLHMAVNDQGSFELVQSVGWKPINTAFGVYWEFTKKRLEEAWRKAQTGEASSLQYHMLANLMDEKFLAAYAGFFVWQTRRHLKPSIFRKLPPKILARYAKALNMAVDQLMKVPDKFVPPDVKTE